MSTSLQINLKRCKFHSKHGFYPEEQLLGNVFWVSVHISYQPQKALDDTLENTLNYETLYQIVREEMQVPQKLLETVAYRIRTRIQNIDRLINAISISIEKENPPFGHAQANAEVKLIWTNEK